MPARKCCGLLVAQAFAQRPDQRCRHGARQDDALPSFQQVLRPDQKDEPSRPKRSGGDFSHTVQVSSMRETLTKSRVSALGPIQHRKAKPLSP